ncbi:MAG: radical SAM protein [Coriobacteriales bacterium]|nr:radical SAM protein [Coriobacteriales bacterium]
MTSYILNKGYALRGWQRLPFALFTPSYGVSFLDADAFEALSCCDGEIGMEHIPERLHPTVEKLAGSGIVSECAPGSRLDAWQRYRRFDSRFMRTAHWSITGHCNYRCRHCYMSAPDAKYGQLSTEKCLSIADEIAGCGIREVSITGGEPLVRKDFWQIIDRLLAYRIRITTVYSNGKLVTPELLDGFDARGIRPEFNMSFDGVGFHDWLRGVEGAEREVNRALALCHERGFPLGAELTLHQRNKGTLRESINHLAGLGVAHIKTNPAGKTGAWAQNAGDDDLSLEETLEAYLDYIPHYYEDGQPMNVMLGGAFYARRGDPAFQIPAQKSCGGDETALMAQCVCGHARQVMYIAADGKVLPCMALSGMDIQQDFPGLEDMSLAQCLSDSYYMGFIDTRLKDYLAHNERCQTCEQRLVCGAGCRASALVDHPDDLMAPDEGFCLILRGGFAERIYETATAAGGIDAASVKRDEGASKRRQKEDGSPDPSSHRLISKEKEASP